MSDLNELPLIYININKNISGEIVYELTCESIGYKKDYDTLQEAQEQSNKLINFLNKERSVIECQHILIKKKVLSHLSGGIILIEDVHVSLTLSNEEDHDPNVTVIDKLEGYVIQEKYEKSLCIWRHVNPNYSDPNFKGVPFSDTPPDEFIYIPYSDELWNSYVTYHQLPTRTLKEVFHILKDAYEQQSNLLCSLKEEKELVVTIKNNETKYLNIKVIPVIDLREIGHIYHPLFKTPEGFIYALINPKQFKSINDNITSLKRLIWDFKFNPNPIKEIAE